MTSIGQGRPENSSGDPARRQCGRADWGQPVRAAPSRCPGPGAATMRSVASELGMKPMSLYRYVDTRDELDGLIIDQVVRKVDSTVSPRAAWATRVRTIAMRMRAALAEHPAIVPLILTRRHLTLASLDCGETMLTALGDGGFSGRRRVIAFRAIMAYVLGAVQAEHLGSLDGEGTTAIAALDPAVHPQLVDAAAHAAAIDADAEFVGGLDIVLRGLSASSRRSSTS